MSELFQKVLFSRNDRRQQEENLNVAANVGYYIKKRMQKLKIHSNQQTVQQFFDTVQLISHSTSIMNTIILLA